MSGVCWASPADAASMTASAMIVDAVFMMIACGCSKHPVMLVT
jgi:hypothetical protein